MSKSSRSSRYDRISPQHGGNERAKPRPCSFGTHARSRADLANVHDGQHLTRLSGMISSVRPTIGLPPVRSQQLRPRRLEKRTRLALRHPGPASDALDKFHRVFTKKTFQSLHRVPPNSHGSTVHSPHRESSASKILSVLQQLASQSASVPGT